MQDLPPIVLFDGDCVLCNATVRWTVQRDPARRLWYAPLDSPVARRVVGLADPRLDFGALPDAIVFVDERGVHLASTAVLRIARWLRFPWPWVGAAGLAVPRAVRDAAYRVVARRRYRWFGRVSDADRRSPSERGSPARRNACPVPPPGLAARMLTDDDLQDREKAP